ncbi:crotonase/enoyl-CoA hydratase family protein [Coralliovum pocilloporae]|uniref:crotonase/enoyl-CoA hydratase family protein n=1 Tax=Coralliovum pocilloporae TaxID=3066369 RepID=UPI00330747AA
MTDFITVEDRDRVRTVRFNRPDKKNAITAAMYASLAGAIETADDDPDVRAIAFLGTEGCFTAGNDILDFLSIAQGGDGLGADVLRFLHALASSQTPLVAGVDGIAIGVGTTMLFHCDMALATDRALFKTPFLDLGLVPEAASTLLFPKRMGYARAFEMLCLGEAVGPERAVETGFINRIVAADTLETETRALAERIAARPPSALRLSRQMMRADTPQIHARIDEEADHFKSCLSSEEATEAFMAFTQKRKPNF